ncbi:flagellar biosynthetic protein FliO [Gammaproteobacteria bacterium AB-CW1]|uniref:Flagellar protein n=1 Tax=Natronospira elongata TaxID=3110268 RepID=A0AAP6MLP6_9GAMM|nr:flagellar biosynthetic protein FliO [Gammaproteobacteria bacterium AB-CW1]
MRLIALMFLFLLLPVTGLAESSVGDEIGGVQGLANVVFSLIVVLAVVLGVAWFMRRMPGMGGSGSAHMKVIGQMPLSTRERLMLVEVGNEQILLGVSPAGIRTLHVLGKPLESPQEQNEPSFKKRLMETLGRGGAQQ